MVQPVFVAQPKLRSPSLPLLHPRDPLAIVAAQFEQRRPERLPAAAGRVAGPAAIFWSAAESAADVHVEKSLFDAFTPMNAAINVVRVSPA